LTERLTKGFLVSLTTMFFGIVLPFLIGLLLIPSLLPADHFFSKATFTFVGPFSTVLWYIGVSNLVFHFHRNETLPHSTESDTDAHD
jgi:hypothetical protein